MSVIHRRFRRRFFQIDINGSFDQSICKSVRLGEALEWTKFSWTDSIRTMLPNDFTRSLESELVSKYRSHTLKDEYARVRAMNAVSSLRKVGVRVPETMSYDLRPLQRVKKLIEVAVPTRSNMRNIQRVMERFAVVAKRKPYMVPKETAALYGVKVLWGDEMTIECAESGAINRMCAIHPGTQYNGEYKRLLEICGSDVNNGESLRYLVTNIYSKPIPGLDMDNVVEFCYRNMYVLSLIHI